MRSRAALALLAVSLGVALAPAPEPARFLRWKPEARASAVLESPGRPVLVGIEGLPAFVLEGRALVEFRRMPHPEARIAVERGAIVAGGRAHAAGTAARLSGKGAHRIPWPRRIASGLPPPVDRAGDTDDAVLSATPGLRDGEAAAAKLEAELHDALDAVLRLARTAGPARDRASALALVLETGGAEQRRAAAAQCTVGEAIRLRDLLAAQLDVRAPALFVEALAALARTGDPEAIANLERRSAWIGDPALARQVRAAARPVARWLSPAARTRFGFPPERAREPSHAGAWRSQQDAAVAFPAPGAPGTSLAPGSSMLLRDSEAARLIRAGFPPDPAAVRAWEDAGDLDPVLAARLEERAGRAERWNGWLVADPLRVLRTLEAWTLPFDAAELVVLARPDRAPLVRAAALTLAGGLDSRAAEEALHDALCDGDPMVRLAASLALAGRGAHAPLLAGVQRLLADPAGPTASAVLDVLAGRALTRLDLEAALDDRAPPAALLRWSVTDWACVARSRARTQETILDEPAVRRALDLLGERQDALAALAWLRWEGGATHEALELAAESSTWSALDLVERALETAADQDVPRAIDALERIFGRRVAASEAEVLGGRAAALQLLRTLRATWSPQGTFLRPFGAA